MSNKKVRKMCKMGCFCVFLLVLSFFYHCQTVAQGDNDLFYPVVFCQVVVEAFNALCLCITVVGRVYNMAVPQGVVGNDKTVLATWTYALTTRNTFTTQNCGQRVILFLQRIMPGLRNGITCAG